MKSPAERGTIGAWAQEARDDAGLSVPEVVMRLAGRGHATTEATIRGVEGGSKKPGRQLLRLLGEIYGRHAPGESMQEPTLASALSDLAEELAAVRREREAWERGVLAVLRSYRDGQVPTELLDALAPQPLEDAQP